MVKKKFVANPFPGLRAASGPVRAAYLSTFCAGLTLLADATGQVFHLFGGSLWMGALAVLCAYLMGDVGLLLLRGRAFARTMAHLVALCFAGISVANATGFVSGAGLSRTVSAAIAALIVVLILATYNLPAVTATLKTKNRSVVASTMSRKSKGGVVPGSWDAIKAAQDAEETSR